MSAIANELAAQSVKVSRRRIWIYVLLFLLSVVAYVDRISISVGAKLIETEFHLSPVAMGYVLSAFFWSYLVCLVPVGIWADRFGARQTIALCIGLWAVMTAAGGAASNLTVLLLTRLGVGVGESAVFPAGGRVMREWTPASERGLASTIFIAGSYAGPAFGAAFLAWVVSSFGWRGGFLVAGAVGLVYLAIWLMFYEKPEDAKWLDEPERQKILGERSSKSEPSAAPVKKLGILDLLGSGSMWSIALAHGCGIYSQYLYLTWLPTYLVNVRGLTILNAGFYTAAPYLAAAIVNIALGWFSDRTLTAASAGQGQRRILLAALKLLSAVILLIPFVQSTFMIMLIITVSLCTLSGTISMHYALMNDLLRNDANAGTASSLVAFGGNTFGLIAPIVTGYIIAGTGSYNWAFGVAGILLVFGALLLLIGARKPIDA
jgi:MFS family permease